ncbi:MAG: hypothetical protein K8S15_10775 [Candidatus Aegiribacteria sp.]|nr:hypothetical protein [Candidatus Aegiribacteria sp.]
MRGKRINSFGIISATVSAILISVACTDTTGPVGKAPQGPPWSPVDSSWKIIDNLEFSYNIRDVDLYMSCFREDFEFHPLLVGSLWCESARQDSCWGYEFEELCHQNMFESTDSIELVVDGNHVTPWTGDSTGQSYALQRVFELTVYTEQAQAGYYRAMGSSVFVCRQDSTGEWYVWQWYDLSENKETVTWAVIKEKFSWTDGDLLLL